MIFRVLLLLSVLACIAFSHNIVGGRSTCLCQSTRDNLGVNPRNIKNLEIFPPSNFCEKLEIIINLKNGNQYCLNPEAQKIRRMIKKLQSKMMP
ncbi:C-X-C motif chemokine 10-like [Brienomyrus brachyistius]|uniref:C-X-C motif chemokine 10-like n=1 Tax=Brienomyrus brachyistius TaxID=42636 RepID=UPI0020B43849|nr:C-X-C motif chemokine 10-like [Brienomyrus brachyistius]